MSELKVKKMGKAGFMVCIGADGTDGIWYFMPDAIKAFVDANLKEGDSVTIASQKTAKGKDMLTQISKAGTPIASPVAPAGQAQQSTDKPKWTPPNKGSFGAKSPADNALIVRQSVGHMTSRVLSGMMTSGIITVAEVPAQMDIIYKKFQELVG